MNYVIDLSYLIEVVDNVYAKLIVLFVWNVVTGFKLL